MATEQEFIFPKIDTATMLKPPGVLLDTSTIEIRERHQFEGKEVKIVLGNPSDLAKLPGNTHIVLLSGNVFVDGKEIQALGFVGPLNSTSTLNGSGEALGINLVSTEEKSLVGEELQALSHIRPADFPIPPENEVSKIWMTGQAGKFKSGEPGFWPLDIGFAYAPIKLSEPRYHTLSVAQIGVVLSGSVSYEFISMMYGFQDVLSFKPYMAATNFYWDSTFHGKDFEQGTLLLLVHIRNSSDYVKTEIK